MVGQAKPCPFCGTTHLELIEAMGEYWVLCKVCNSSSGARSTRKTALDLWNLRAKVVPGALGS